MIFNKLLHTKYFCVSAVIETLNIYSYIKFIKSTKFINKNLNLLI